MAIVVLAILASHHAQVSPGLWALGIAFLASDLLFRVLPLSWFRGPGLSYVVFLLDMGVLTIVLYSLSGSDADSLLLYYLTVFVAALGEDVRRSIVIAIVVSALYVGLHLNRTGAVLSDPFTLMPIPLFFVTAISFGYLAEQLRAHKRQVLSLKAVQKGLRMKVEEVRSDLTESEELRALAEASEQRFRNLVQDVDAIVWEMDPSTFQFTFVSQQAEEVLGYPVERWISELDFWANHIVAEDRERVLSITRQATAGSNDFDIEYRALASDGNVIWLRDLLRVVRDPTGSIMQLRGVMVDITELKRTEGTLERLRRQNELLLTSAGGGIVGLDSEGKTTFVNPAAARLLGWEPKELIGKVQHDTVHYRKADGSYYPREECPIYAAFRDGVVHRVADDVFWRKDGTSFPVSFVSTPIKEGENIVGAVVVFEDITDRKRAEQELRTQARVLESMGEGVNVTNENGVIIFTNGALDEMFGYKRGELIGEHISVLNDYPPAENERMMQLVVQQLNSIGTWSGEFRTRRKDAATFRTRARISVLESFGKKYWVSVQEDVTERALLEEQLRQAQKMEAMGRLAGGVAHDFNNLLTIIGGYSQLLLGHLKVNDTAREQVQEIKKAGDRAGALTRQLLAFSRRQVLTPQVLDLNAAVTGVEKMLRRLIGEDVELVTRVEVGLGRVKADPSQIEQVLMNLAVNARDAMPQGGKLTLETANVELDEAFARSHPPTRPGRYVLLGVSDTGIGMDAQVQAHIFEPFFTTKEKGKGTGLGLATVYGIVKQSGGYIWVDTAPGKGAAFRIYLPEVDEAVRLAKAATAQLGVSQGSETILLVEDEEAVRSLVRGILASRGYAVLEASRPEEALLICRRHAGPIHLLLTDVVMPEMGGGQLAIQLTSLRPNTKVLYMSGYTDDAIIQHGVSSSTHPLLQKPFTPESLERKVREVLDRTSQN